MNILPVIKFRSLPAVFTLSILASSSHVAAAGFELLKPHRAVYEVRLDKATDRSGISNMEGRIVYEMVGNECEGITVRYRFVANISANGNVFTTDQQTSTHESPDGKEFNFINKSLVNDQLDREVIGSAMRDEDGVHVKLTSPDKKEIGLEKADFLSAHLVKVLEKAKANEPFFTQQVFDAGDTAEVVFKTTNIIGKQKVSSEKLRGETDEVVAQLGEDTAWPVTIGYFGKVLEDSSEQIPEYEVSFLLYEGGISRKLLMRYPDYSLKGSLVKLEMLSQKACKIDN